MRKTIEELRKINTKNLLRYYRAERKRFYEKLYFCNCCYEAMWVVNPETYGYLEAEYSEHIAYLELIRTELGKREHLLR